MSFRKEISVKKENLRKFMLIKNLSGIFNIIFCAIIGFLIFLYGNQFLALILATFGTFIVTLFNLYIQKKMQKLEN